MKLRLIALDLDGTLLDERKQLSERNRAALQRASDAGVQIVPCTGRLFQNIPAFIRELPFVRYAITVNGGEIYDKAEQRALHRAEIPLEDAERLFDYMETLPVIYDCYQNGHGWIDRKYYEKMAEYVGSSVDLEMLKQIRTPLDHFREEMRRRGLSIQKTQMFFKDPERRLDELERMPKLFPETSVTSSSARNIEINNRNANKGEGLRVLSACLGIDPAQTMAFGDDLNDISMLKAARVGVAMGNAADAVKAAARLVTKTNVEDGVAEVIEQYIG